MDDQFFQPPPPPPEEQRPRVYRRPVWGGPPSNVIPARAPLMLVVAKTDDAAVVVEGVSAYPTGFGFGLEVRIRPDSEVLELIEDPLHVYEAHHRRRMQRGPTELPPEQLRIGIEFPDGSRATSVGRHMPLSNDELPPKPFLMGGGGGGGDNGWHYDWHVWPLPSAGTMAFVCEWPALGIPVTRAEVDTRIILETAARALTLWDLPEEEGPSGWTGYGPATW